ncbi:cob(I)yrinic acid a,c-diamide adenosyltransferase [Ruminococcaceae bacterium OttesenSCG-928-A16]|nr:cob(I)yrinic acid a,c-diamide adenosyltransferase [Ruminococcaceae bacterium OttesenSCG-928-A16]
MEQGMIQIYTGEGKGKTTAAAGLAARALGQGLRVGFFGFLKTGLSGEMVSLVKAGAVFMAPQGSGKFVWQMDDTEKEACRKQQTATLARAAQMMNQFDLLVLDEVFGALATGMLTPGDVMQLVEQKPAGMELVLTGRDAPPALLAKADYVTEMRSVKHPFDDGLKARKGIEF